MTKLKDKLVASVKKTGQKKTEKDVTPAKKVAKVATKSAPVKAKKATKAKAAKKVQVSAQSGMQHSKRVWPD